MTELRTLFEVLGFANVETFIASGKHTILTVRSCQRYRTSLAALSWCYSINMYVWFHTSIRSSGRFAHIEKGFFGSGCERVHT